MSPPNDNSVVPVRLGFVYEILIAASSSGRLSFSQGIRVCHGIRDHIEPVELYGEKQEAQDCVAARDTRWEELGSKV